MVVQLHKRANPRTATDEPMHRSRECRCMMVSGAQLSTVKTRYPTAFSNHQGHDRISGIPTASKRCFLLVCEAIGTAATPPGLLCQPRVIVKMIVEKQIECRLTGETEVLGENLPQRHSCPSQNPTWPAPGLNPGRRGGKPATNRLSYGATLVHVLLFQHFDARISSA
jgi:hypothetical protein